MRKVDEGRYVVVEMGVLLEEDGLGVNCVDVIFLITRGIYFIQKVLQIPTQVH